MLMNNSIDLNNHTDTKIARGTNLAIRVHDGKILHIFKKAGYNETLAILLKTYKQNQLTKNIHGDILIHKKPWTK